MLCWSDADWNIFKRSKIIIDYVFYTILLVKSDHLFLQSCWIICLTEIVSAFANVTSDTVEDKVLYDLFRILSYYLPVICLALPTISLWFTVLFLSIFILCERFSILKSFNSHLIIIQCGYYLVFLFSNLLLNWYCWIATASFVWFIPVLLFWQFVLKVSFVRFLILKNECLLTHRNLLELLIPSVSSPGNPWIEFSFAEGYSSGIASSYVSVQVKSRSMLYHGSVGVSSE